MSLSRRALLQLSAAGALSGLAGWPSGGARAGAPRFQVAALVGGSRLDARFLAGVGRTEKVISLRQGPELDWATLEDRLDELSGHRLVGLLDPGRHAVLGAIVQERRARHLSIGEHSGERHRFISAPAAHGIGSAVAHGLERAGYGHAVHETGYGRQADDGFSAVPELAAGNWPELVGQALGRIAEGSWEPCEPCRRSRPGRTNSISNDSLVSFVVHL